MTPDWTTLVFTVLKDVAILAGSAVAYYGAKYLNSHFTSNQLDKARTIAQEVVVAVEQVAKDMGLTNPEKLQQAIDWAIGLGSKIGLHFTEAEWESLIEAAVAAMKLAGIPAQLHPTIVNPPAPDPVPAPAAKASK